MCISNFSHFEKKKLFDADVESKCFVWSTREKERQQTKSKDRNIVSNVLLSPLLKLLLSDEQTPTKKQSK